MVVLEWRDSELVLYYIVAQNFKLKFRNHLTAKSDPDLVTSSQAAVFLRVMCKKKIGTETPQRYLFNFTWAGEPVLRVHTPSVSGFTSHPQFPPFFLLFSSCLESKQEEKGANQWKADFVFWEFSIHLIYVFVFCLLFSRDN
jgi:hypothetical protein